MNASGQLINQTGLTAYLGALNIGVLSQQSSGAPTGANPTTIQLAINASESVIFGKLLTLQCPSGTFVKYPFTIGGVPFNQSNSSISVPYIQQIAYAGATSWLNYYRVLLSTADRPGSELDERISRDAKFGLKQLDGILQYWKGYTDEDATFSDLDLNTGAVIGNIFYNVAAPTFVNSCVNPDGTQHVPIIENQWVWPAFSGAAAYPSFGGYSW
jgi:hypothetical protein